MLAAQEVNLSIAQRADGRYVCKYKDGGKWKQRTFKDENSAKAFDDEQKILESANERLTVGEIATCYFRSVPHHQNTVEKFFRALCGYERKDGTTSGGEALFLFKRYADTLNRRDLEILRENLRATGKANATINMITGTIKAALTWGVDQDMVRRIRGGNTKNSP